MKAFVLAAMLAAVAAPSLAADAPAAPAAAPSPSAGQGAAKAAEPPKEKMICTREAETGSIRVKKVCRPASSANDTDRRERDALELSRQLQNAR